MTQTQGERIALLLAKTDPDVKAKIARAKEAEDAQDQADAGEWASYQEALSKVPRGNIDQIMSVKAKYRDLLSKRGLQ
jgi:hypothetical protein